jgi:hypothetical protein
MALRGCKSVTSGRIRDDLCRARYERSGPEQRFGEVPAEFIRKNGDFLLARAMSSLAAEHSAKDVGEWEVHR